MAKIIKELKGHSGSIVRLMEDDVGPYVYKKGNVERNVERIRSLSGIVRVPIIYKHLPETDELYMEYIHGLDMRNYLKSHDPIQLVKFISNTIDIFSAKWIDKDYSKVYNENLDWIDTVNVLPFEKEEFIRKLPKLLPQSVYHGDMTLENMIYSNDGNFFFIDPVTTPYDSWIFDLAKLRQDLDCKWFLRNDSIMLDVKLNTIRDRIFSRYPMAYNDNLLILMLLRVFKHCEKDSMEYNFIINEVNKLWK